MAKPFSGIQRLGSFRLDVAEDYYSTDEEVTPVAASGDDQAAIHVGDPATAPSESIGERAPDTGLIPHVFHYI